MRLPIFFTFIFALIFQLRADDVPQRESAGTWDCTGELSYSYAYARSWLGNKMRTKGWLCVKAFTTGKNHTAEHSIWTNGTRKIQMMIWRISSNKTGYSQKNLGREKFQKIL